MERKKADLKVVEPIEQAPNEKVYITVEVSEEGKIKISTNLSSLGALHILSSATQVIIQDELAKVEAKPEKETTEDV